MFSRTGMVWLVIIRAWFGVKWSDGLADGTTEYSSTASTVKVFFSMLIVAPTVAALVLSLTLSSHPRAIPTSNAEWSLMSSMVWANRASLIGLKFKNYAYDFIAQADSLFPKIPFLIWSQSRHYHSSRYAINTTTKINMLFCENDWSGSQVKRGFPNHCLAFGYCWVGRD